MTRNRYEIGGRNVFEDIGVANPEEHLTKAKLVFKIDTILKRRGLKQREAAELFGVRQADVSGNSRSSACCVSWRLSIRMLRLS